MSAALPMTASADGSPPQDLHASADSTYGTWTYVYDNSNNLATTTDPKSQTIEYLYDTLNRLTSENATSTGEITYTYDNCTYGKGRLCGATTTITGDDIGTNFLYNPLGGVASERKVLQSTDYTTTFTYDRQGNQTSITYPDSAIVSYTHNSAGQLETVSKKEDGESSFTSIVDDFDYAPTGQPSFIDYANGTETTNTYDPAELYRLRSKKTILSGCTACGGEEAPLGWAPVLAAPFAQQSFEVEDLDQVLEPEPSPAVVIEAPIPTTEPSGVYTRKNAAFKVSKGNVYVTVGDERQSTFVPQATFNRWGEVSLDVSFTPSTTEGSALATYENDKIVWNDGDKQVRFYELPASKDVPEGGYEIDVIFNEKPASNVVTMNIAAQGLDFLYQGRLDEEPMGDGAVRCTETQCFDESGNVVTERPENVVNSYAVYRKDGITGDYSQTRHNNYSTGKAFHIYRPKVTDSAGDEVWGTLDIDTEKGVLTVTVPQDFLDKATYPVTV